jgi:putative component of membrane protein insertase Oxa1/YidC/SpoIIIJ protein YidD
VGHGDPLLVRRLADRCLAVGAVLAIRLYQVTWSRWHGRTCLFSPSCSRRAAEHFRRLGFAEGLRRTRAQLGDCCGDYSMRLGPDGRVELVTRSGAIVAEGELNPAIVARFRFPHDLCGAGPSVYPIPAPDSAT